MFIADYCKMSAYFLLWEKNTDGEKCYSNSPETVLQHSEALNLLSQIILTL